MTPAEPPLTFRPDADIRDAMQALRERDGIGYSEQIRRALRVFLESKGVMKAPSRRARTRRES